MSGRRPNGEGTIYERRDGRWEGAAYVLLPSGGRARKRVYGKTRSEVFAKLAELHVGDQVIPLGCDHVIPQVVGPW